MAISTQPTAGTSWHDLPVEMQLKIASIFIDDVILCNPRKVGGRNCRNVLSKYAGLSRTWGEVVERRTFETIALTTQDFTETDTCSILHKRLRHLKRLHVELRFVEPDLQCCPFADWLQGASRLVNSNFAHGCPCQDCTLVAVFNLLRQAPPKDRPYVDLTISIKGNKPLSVDPYAEPPSEVQIFRLRQPEKDIPELPTVRRLKIAESDTLIFMPSSACLIASRLTNLQSFSFSGVWGDKRREVHTPFLIYDDDESSYAKDAKQERDDFATALVLLPATLRELVIDYTDWISSSEDFPVDDKLTKALCTFSKRQNLTKFWVEASLGLSILDSDDCCSSQDLTWYLVTFRDGLFADNPIFFGQMAKRGAAVGRRLPRNASSRFYHVERFFIHGEGRLYYCDEKSDGLWEEDVLAAWRQTAEHHDFDLKVRLNRSPSDDESTEVSDDEFEEEFDDDHRIDGINDDGH